MITFIIHPGQAVNVLLVIRDVVEFSYFAV